jgi:hypothetical protein
MSLPRILLSLSRRDFNFVKRTILKQRNSKTQRSTLKVIFEAQDKFFRDKARAQRERLTEQREARGENGWTLSEAVQILRNAHYYIMRTKAFWYDKNAMTTSKILAGLASDLRKELYGPKQVDKKLPTEDTDSSVDAGADRCGPSGGTED